MLLAACGSIGIKQHDTQAACTPSFPLKGGWLGGDAAYSLPLSETDSLWFFGDTFVGQEDAPHRHDAAFIGNSVARSACTDGNWAIDYFWKTRDGIPAAVFTPDSSAYRYWPLSSFRHQDRLYVFVVRVETLDGNDALSFRTTGVDLARIDNPLAPARDWRIEIGRFYEGTDLIPGVANARDGSHLLVYTTLEGERFKQSGDHHAVILARLPLAQIDAAAPPVETLRHDGVWIDGLTSANSRRVMASGATEMSLRFHPGGNKWIAIMPADEPFVPYGIVKQAPHPAGPWHDGQKIIGYAEQEEAHAQGDTNVFCYAAKEHGQFARAAQELLITYVCNTIDDGVLERMDLYAPAAGRVDLPSGPHKNTLARFFKKLF